MKGRKIFTRQEVDAIIKLIRQKILANTNEQKSIRNKIRALGFYATDFGIGGGYTEHDFLSVIEISGEAPSGPKVKVASKEKLVPKAAIRKDKDEHYVIDLCDEILGQRALRQHCFSFLSGDSGKLLPVDAYYPLIGLVVEYHERQHTSAVRFWDDKPTVSGISRGLQRKQYDERRHQKLPENGIRLLVIDYQSLAHRSGSKKLLRDRNADKDVLKEKLQPFIKN